MKPIILQGIPALSDFRITALLEKFQEAESGYDICRVEANFVYFLEADGKLPGEILEKTHSLLGATGTYDDSDGFFVTPRKGTISPWSSKATDIFHNCGLDSVRRVERGILYRLHDCEQGVLPLCRAEKLLPAIHDRMTEGAYDNINDIFTRLSPAPMREIDIISDGISALKKANIEIGLALNENEIEYLYGCYRSKAIGRNPTDVELVMFGQVNSEHCRHKIFNGDWIIDGRRQDRSLFSMIQNTHRNHPGGTLSAYSDNSAVLEGVSDYWFGATGRGDSAYRYQEDLIDILIKVETHNHPTAISPFPGAATGVGGEIRDEAATGKGGRTKAGLCGFMVSNLRIPKFPMPWETEFSQFPDRLATPLEIMLEGPIGGARFGNEFGRPQLCGFFKTFEESYNGRLRGYHKPIMIAGGMGNLRRGHVLKSQIPGGACMIQIGGPAMRIGLGGGAASSMDTGSNAEELDFDSVQRDNAEMQRRCQEVISACIALGDDNPMLSIHDIGAGGLSNGCPELVEDVGAEFQLREVHNEEPSMSPMEIWCCEAQERFVLAVKKEDLELFLELCERERCEVAVIGRTTGDDHLLLRDEHFDNNPIDIDLEIVLGKPPKMVRDVHRLHEKHAPLDLSEMTVPEAVERVLRLPAVANKTFLVTIADRSITGMVARDQMAGPFQTPISDAAVTTTSLTAYTGEAMAMGERSRTAVVNAPASTRMAIGEALTNIACTSIGSIGNIKLSANWMAASAEEGEDANLFDAVRTVGMETCPQLGISIPVGKDSLSMRTVWEDRAGKQLRQVAPLSLVVSAFTPVKDVRKTVTQDLKPKPGSKLLLIDLGNGKNRLGGSALAQVFNQVGATYADMDSPEDVVNFFTAVQELVKKELLLSCHDRSDGGLLATLCEMAFGGHLGAQIQLEELGTNPLNILFAEELGMVLQTEQKNLDRVCTILKQHDVMEITTEIGTVKKAPVLSFYMADKKIYASRVSELNRIWSELTYHMQALRDNPECALLEYDNLLDESDPGMQFSYTFDPSEPFSITGTTAPRMAILREQGVNGQVEMAGAFARAGFECVDVHMTDLHEKRLDLTHFAGLVACGGFSYGDVLGAGSGWAKSILFNPELKEMFAHFFARSETFALGVCNGCQMISQLKEIIPGAEHWPAFAGNRSEQFEARFITVEVLDSPSMLLKGMTGSQIGIPVAHGEGRVDFETTGSLEKADELSLVSLRYVDNYGNPTERYPFNPNGSPLGITGLTSKDGRVTVMMPHPERAFRTLQLSYAPEGPITEQGPWLRVFQNARRFVE